MIYVAADQAYAGYVARLHICTDEDTLISIGQIEAITSVNVKENDIVQIERYKSLLIGPPSFRVVNVVGKALQEVVEAT